MRRLGFFAPAFRQLAKEIDFVEGLFEIGFAEGLEAADLRHVLLEAALDAPFVRSEEREVSSFGDPDASLREGRIHFAVSGSDFIGPSDSVGKNPRLKASRMVKASVVIGYGLNQIRFHGAAGREGLMIAPTVFFVGDAVGLGQENDLPGETRAGMLKALCGPGVFWAQGASFSFS